MSERPLDEKLDPIKDEGPDRIYSERVLVPVANPATAEALLRLGALLAHPERGEVCALHVSVAGTNYADTDAATLEALVESLRVEGLPMRWVSVTANSPARGILDVAQEEGSDLIVLGYQGNAGDSALGPVVEEVARTTPADLIVYRGLTDAPISRILLPTSGSRNARVAAQLGLLLSRAFQVPAAALFVQVGGYMGRAAANNLIDETFDGLAGGDVVERKIVHAGDTTAGILDEAGPEDLTVLGFSRQGQFERWLYGDVTQSVLRHAPGPVILTKDAVSAGEPLRERAGRAIKALSPRLTPVEQENLRQQAFDMSRWTTNFYMLVVLSCLIASFGLLQSSPAVIIGAMLVAPLMSPILAFSIGLDLGELLPMQGSAVILLKGIGLALLITAAVGVLYPVHTLTPEMSARGQPSLLDMGVALFAGAAAAYAMARKDIPSALAGVAVSAALMPPLCVIGLAAAFGRFDVAGGATLLFATNIVSICLAGALMFRWLGMKPQPPPRPEPAEPIRPRAQNQGRQLLALAVIVVVMAFPLTLSLRQIFTRATESAAVQDVLEAEWNAPDFYEMVEFEIDYDFLDTMRVVATVRTANYLSSVEAGRVEALLEDALGRPVMLEVVALRVIRPAVP
jgi:uncharacterized hydrophobic protein (TIGR00271 family)